MTVIDSVMRGAKKEAQNVKQFVQTPKGIFETVDAIIRDARGIVFESLSSVGVKRPIIGTSPLLGQNLLGQAGGKIAAVQKIRERIESARTKMQSRRY